MKASCDSRQIVVGVDGTALSRDALVFALQEGAARDVAVRVVHAWTFGTVLRDADGSESFTSETRRAELELEAAIADALTRTDARPAIESTVIHGAPGEALVAAAADAAMLVVGSGRKGPMARTFLGSASDFCVRHARVPVVVVTSSACL